MTDFFKLTKSSAIVFAASCASVGIMLMANVDKKAEEERAAQAEAQQISLLEYQVPAAGMGTLLDAYIESSAGLSIDYLSTTAVANGEIANEYINAAGESEGRYIVCTVESYAPVYSKEGDEYTEIARIYTNGVAMLLVNEGEWSRVVTGDIQGYVKSEDFAFGTEAEALDASTYVTSALISTDQLYMYDSESTGGTVLAVLSAGYEYAVTSADTGSGFTKISVSGIGEGYVQTEGILTSTGHIYGITLEEETANNAEISAAAEKGAAIEAEKAAAKAAAEEAERQRIANLRQSVVDYACTFVGWLPYVWGSASLTTGADCSGFTSSVFAHFGYSLSRSSAVQSTQGRSVSRSEIAVGDIVVYQGHVAIYIGGGNVVHSPRQGRTVSINSIDMMTVIDIRRIIE